MAERPKPFEGGEPQAEQWWLEAEKRTESEAVLVSIAISLKRIADEVCGVPWDYTPGSDNSRHRMSLCEGIGAIEQALLSASRR